MESFDNPVDRYESVKRDFEQFKDRGVPAETYEDLKDKIAKSELKSYHETYESLPQTEIALVSGDEQILKVDEAADFIDETFTGDILERALISQVQIRLGEVNYRAPVANPFGVSRGEYYLPREKFLEYFNQLSLVEQRQVVEHIYHAESFASWNRLSGKEGGFVGEALAGSGKVFATPVALFNMEFDEESIAIIEGRFKEVGLDYLSEVAETERFRAYVLGTLAHEIAHNLFQHLILGKPEQVEWQKITDRLGSLTKYAEEYQKDALLRYDENFAEAVRLFTTAKSYLEKHGYDEVVAFIEKYFPEINS